jgi:Conjugative transposon protein TcpC
MTEPTEPTPPLSRMRFSWQRDTGDQPESEESTADVREPWMPRAGQSHAGNGAPVDAGPHVDIETDTAMDTAIDTGVESGVDPGVGTGADEAREAYESPPGDVPAYWDDDVPTPPPATAPPTSRAGTSGQRASRLSRADRTGPGRTPVDRAGRSDRKGATGRGGRDGRPRRGRRSDRPTRGGFDIPAPGGRFSGGRGSHTAVKVVLILSACIVASGIVAYMAFSLGFSTAMDNRYRLSPDDRARYRLTEFPLDQAGRFAADYARICLTHQTTPGSADQRESQLSRFVSSGTDATCGWNGEGVQTVTDASWTGESEPIDVAGYAGNARMMTVRVLTSAGSRVVTVPVYVADLASGDGMRIVGDIGEMPQPSLVKAPEPEQPAAVDGGLADALTQGEFFQQFFAAWGESNGPALQRFVTPDATARTTSGLGGTTTEPVIVEARVFLPPGVSASEEYQWKTGMVTQAWVWVDWRSPAVGEGAVETRAYRLQLVKTTQASNPTQEWAVRDIRGGVPDLKGG